MDNNLNLLIYYMNKNEFFNFSKFSLEYKNFTHLHRSNFQVLIRINVSYKKIVLIYWIYIL